MPPETTSARVTRLLALLAYLGKREAVPVSELAKHFGVSESQILQDVDLLWMTGLPGYYPDDLIDFSVDDYDASVISLRQSQGLARAVPFAPREALALTAAVEWLKSLGAADPAVLESVQAKLRGLIPADIHTQSLPDEDVRLCVTDAVERGRAVRIRYVSAEDEETVRIVEPRALITDGAHWYLDAWCHRARSDRSFRVDRILEISLGRRPAHSVPPKRDDAAPGRETETAPAPETELVDVRLVLDPSVRWLAEEIPDAVTKDVTWEGGDAIEVEVRVGRTDWLVRRLMGLGSAVLLIEPATVRDEVLRRVEHALKLYAP